MHILKPLPGTLPMLGHPLADAVALWPMTSLGNRIFDLSGNGVVGTLTGTAPSWTSGMFGSAVLLPGTDEYINVSGLVNHISKAQGTFVIWCNFTTADLSDGEQHSLFEIGYSVNNNNLIALRKTIADKIIMRYRKDDGNVDAEISPIGSLTGLHQYIGTWGGGEVKIYLDGVLQDTKNITTITGTLDQSYIGKNAVMAQAQYFDGLIELASSYNCALTAEKVALISHEPFCMFPENIMPEFAISA